MHSKRMICDQIGSVIRCHVSVLWQLYPQRYVYKWGWVQSSVTVDIKRKFLGPCADTAHKPSRIRYSTFARSDI